MTALICDYFGISLADITPVHTAAYNRYCQGISHARQGRRDLLGQCAHYDTGWKREAQRIMWARISGRNA